MRLSTLLLPLLGLWACAPEHVVQGRPYTLQVPATGADGPLPLFVQLHGFAANGALEDMVLPFSAQVDGEKFLYALPDGTVDLKGRRFWNATDACCNDEHLPVDDVAFLRALIADVKAKHAVSRVWVGGHSNGGFMALRMACEASDAVDAVVSLAGSTWDDPSLCPAGRAVPVLLVHGTADTVIPYDGKVGKYPSAPETARRFGQRNGCADAWLPAQHADFVGGPDEDTVQEARSCAGGAPVELWSVQGEGHLPAFDARWLRGTLAWLRKAAP